MESLKQIAIWVAGVHHRHHTDPTEEFRPPTWTPELIKAYLDERKRLAEQDQVEAQAAAEAAAAEGRTAAAESGADGSTLRPDEEAILHMATDPEADEEAVNTRLRLAEERAARAAAYERGKEKSVPPAPTQESALLQHLEAIAAGIQGIIRALRCGQ